MFRMKVSEIGTEIDKKLKISKFSKVLCIFAEFSTNFVDWNNGKIQQGNNVLVSRLFRRVYCSFLSDNVSN